MEEDLEEIAAQEQKEFPFEILKAATKDFHPTNKLRRGGFGLIFRVHFLQLTFDVEMYLGTELHQHGIRGRRQARKK